MKWIEATIIFEPHRQCSIGDLITEVFIDLGAQGVMIQDPFPEPGDGWGFEELEMPKTFSVTGYLPGGDVFQLKQEHLEDRLRQLETRWNTRFHTSYRELDDQDWANSWKAYFFPQQVTEKIVVKPTWRDYHHRDGDIVIEIDPGMAFGTGTHPTTMMCLQLIEACIRQGDRFLDVGTGSGVLMAAAMKLGARQVYGTDNSNVALSIARENLIINHVRPETFNLVRCHLTQAVNGRFDLVAANISSQAIRELAGGFRDLLSSGGQLILSGFVETDRNDIVCLLEENGIKIIREITLENWVGITGILLHTCRP